MIIDNDNTLMLLYNTHIIGYEIFIIFSSFFLKYKNEQATTYNFNAIKCYEIPCSCMVWYGMI